MALDDDALRAIVGPPVDGPVFSGDVSGLDPMSAAVMAAMADWPAVTAQLRLDRAAATEELAIARSKFFHDAGGGQK